MNEEPISVFKHFTDAKLHEIAFSSSRTVRQETELLHLVLAELARRRLNVTRITKADIE